MTQYSESLERLTPILLMAQLARQYASSCRRLLAGLAETEANGRADTLLIVTTAHRVHRQAAKVRQAVPLNNVSGQALKAEIKEFERKHSQALLARNLIEHSDEHLSGKARKGRPDEFFDVWDHGVSSRLELRVGPYQIQLGPLVEDVERLAEQLGKAVTLQLWLEGMFAKVDDAIVALTEFDASRQDM